MCKYVKTTVYCFVLVLDNQNGVNNCCAKAKEQQAAILSSASMVITVRVSGCAYEKSKMVRQTALQSECYVSPVIILCLHQ
jgi:hypothetical protein